MITFITGYPEESVKSDGYWARVSAIDKIFEHQEKIYLDIQFENNYETDFLEYIIEKKDKREIIKINWNSGLGRTKFEEIILNSKVIYVHSIYQARYILPFIPYKKVILDMHGVVPEENWFYQDKALNTEMNKIEEFVFRYCWAAVAVTEKMISHYKNKYKEFDKPFFKLPIVRISDQDLKVEVINQNKEKQVFLYSGGLQGWQNLGLIYDFIQKCGQNERFIFLSPDREAIRNEMEKRGCLDKCEFDYSGDFKDIEKYYLRACYGFILRDNNIVNQVACPTKMQEYLRYGVIPIVLNDCIGDFSDLGYKSMLITDFNKKRELDAKTSEQFIIQNMNVLSRMGNIFKNESVKLKDYVESLLKEQDQTCHFTPVVDSIGRHFSQLYLDHGKGYTEKVSIKKSLLGKFNICVFDIIPDWQENIKNLRFDPLNKSCSVMIKKFVLYTLRGKVEVENKGKYKFNTDDPMIVININSLVGAEKIQTVEIQYEIIKKHKSEVNNFYFINKVKKIFS